MPAKNMDHLGSNLKGGPVFNKRGSQSNTMSNVGDIPLDARTLSTRKNTMSKLTEVVQFPESTDATAQNG